MGERHVIDSLGFSVTSFNLFSRERRDEGR